ncbi:MAG: hypothetical protein CME59_02125 [Halioglobus sp.]|nr:hypothetical protein [Halioglobus sp.]|tara:strand:- start:623 stop:1033 length:411 start_codon:yes stop_codon:yes gene_type:complete
MAVTLAGIALPGDIEWTDEFEGFGVGQNITPTITGALVVEENAQPEGRPMTLASGDGSWTSLSTVQQLHALAAIPLADGDTMTLDWVDGRTFGVVFDRTGGKRGFSARPVYRLAMHQQANGHPYFITLNLIVKDSP